MASTAPLVKDGQEQAISANGLPTVSEEEQQKKSAGAMKFVAKVMVGTRLLSGAVAYVVMKFGPGINTPFSDMSRLGWLYLSVYLFSILTFWLNFFPMVIKAKLDLKGNIRANMMIYKALGTTSPIVVLEEEGVVGEYNRANRSLFHFNEYIGSYVPCILAAGLTFPLPVFVLTAILFIGRVMHQTGYAYGGYGAHGKGFALAMLAMIHLEAFCLISALAIFGVIA